MPRVSVVIPAYNVEPYIRAAVQSAVSQSYRNMEVIVVNDGSTDGTARVLEQFSDQIIYIEEPNRGLAAARNSGIAKANGEYIAFLDGDDEWTANRLDTMVSFMETSDRSLVVSDAFLIEEETRSQKTYYGTRPRRLVFREENQPYWIVQYNFVLLGFALCKHEAFERYGTFDERLQTTEDWDLVLRFITSGARAAFLREPLGFYRVRPGSLTADAKKTIDYEIALLEHATVRPESSQIPGLSGRLGLSRAKKALMESDIPTAVLHSRLALRDKALPGWGKRRAALTSHLPHFAAWLYERQLQAG